MSAQGVVEVTEIVVSFSTDAIMEFSQGLTTDDVVNLYMGIHRTVKLFGSHIQLREAPMHDAERYRAARGAFLDVIALLNLHAPLHQLDHIDKALNSLSLNDCDSASPFVRNMSRLFRTAVMVQGC